ncbi:histone-like nucleoid-structuring protein Lsr2 [Streptomyces sp. NPDC051018]|uniref:Lsr2 family DNA-binding protein n=1 Tax=Streptomyces sp. NPDC051018 TaxID=3365639 RepID=UPI0037B6BBA9
MTALAELTRLCPPPETSPRPVGWDDVETRLGIRLPGDYKRLASVYGPGVFAGCIHVFHPHGASEWVDLTGPVPAGAREQLSRDRERGTHPVPHDPRRLFAMAGTDNGERLFRITDPQDAPDTWRVTVNEARGPRWFTFGGTLTRFLFAVLSGGTTVPQFPGDLLDQAMRFTPSSPVPRTPPGPPDPSPVATETVREWARAHGYDVPARGRVPAGIIEAWERAGRPGAGGAGQG